MEKSPRNNILSFGHKFLVLTQWAKAPRSNIFSLGAKAPRINIFSLGAKAPGVKI
jgi:hypothetical protein